MANQNAASAPAEQAELTDEGFKDMLGFKDDEDQDEQETDEDEAEDEETDETDEDEDETDEEDEDEEDVPPAPIADRAAKVAMPDGSVKTLGEIIDGGMATADYTRKTQALAQRRQELEDTLTQWAIPQEQEPNWQHLARNATPQQYVQIQAEWQAKQRRSDQARALWHRMQEDRQAEEEKERETAQMQAIETLKQQIPELNNRKRQAQIAKRMADAAQYLGYTDDELKGITDARLYRGLHLIAQVMDIQAKQPAITKKVMATSKSLPTSARSGKADPKAKAKAARERLRATGGDDQSFKDFLFS